jgi:hypothetical protein
MGISGCLTNGSPRSQVVCDFIASITDRHALGLYEKIFFPRPLFEAIPERHEPDPRTIVDHQTSLSSVVEPAGDLFDEMDQAYTVVAGQYGFQCNGCADNCCLTRFYHHTLLEYLYLVEGLRTLEPDVRHTIYGNRR